MRPQYVPSLLLLIVATIANAKEAESIVRQRIEYGGVEIIDVKKLPLEEVRIAMDALRTEQDQTRQERAATLVCLIAQARSLPEREATELRSVMLGAIKSSGRRDRTSLIGVYSIVYKESACKDLLRLVDDADEGVRVEAVLNLGKLGDSQMAGLVDEKLKDRAKKLSPKEARYDSTLIKGQSAVVKMRKRTK